MRQTTATLEVDREATPEQRLWQAVIASTVREWVGGTLRRKREAEQFLFQDSKDFALVCQSAGMDPGQLRSRLIRLRDRGIRPEDTDPELRRN